MARLIQTNGQVQRIDPANGKQFTLQELQDCVGGYIEVVPNLSPNGGHLPGVDMLCNEDGHRLNLAYNPAASILAQQHIIGNVLVLRREEWDTPEGEEL